MGRPLLTMLAVVFGMAFVGCADAARDLSDEALHSARDIVRTQTGRTVDSARNEIRDAVKPAKSEDDFDAQVDDTADEDE